LLVEDHTTGDEVRQARSKPGASYPTPGREDSDSKRHAKKELTALRIQILEERRSDSAQAYCDPEAARRQLERDGKELRDFEFSFGTFRKNIECQDPEDLRTRMDEGQKWVQEHFAPWAKSFLETKQRSDGKKSLTRRTMLATEDVGDLPRNLNQYQGIQMAKGKGSRREPCVSSRQEATPPAPPKAAHRTGPKATPRKGPTTD